jgi:hypothetical protein
VTAPWIVSNAASYPRIQRDERRHAELLDWLRANGIEPKKVPHLSTLAIEDGPDGSQVIRHTVYVNTRVPGEPYAEEEHTVPMATPPPGHWRPTAERLPADILALLPIRDYTSTACQTGHLLESDVYGRARHWGLKLPDLVSLADLEEQVRRMHKRCRLNHKFTGNLCICYCHTDRAVGVMAACRTCRGNRIVPDRTKPSEDGEPVPKPCPDCQPATKEA